METAICGRLRSIRCLRTVPLSDRHFRFHYDHWRASFYPKELSKSERFSYYAAHFDTVEINNTFYRLPPAATFDLWREQAPARFLYTLKFGRYRSHWTRLKKPESTIGRFLKVAEQLKKFLGPILVQLPPHWKANPQPWMHFSPSRRDRIAGRLNSAIRTGLRTRCIKSSSSTVPRFASMI